MCALLRWLARLFVFERNYELKSIEISSFIDRFIQEEECYARSLTALGSSSSYNATSPDGDGMGGTRWSFSLSSSD